MSRATAAMPRNRSQTDPCYSQNIRAGESKTTHAPNARREQQRRRFRQTSVVRYKRGTVDGGERCLGRIQGWVMLSMQDAHGRWGCPPPRWITRFCSEALDWQINVDLKQNGSCSRLSDDHTRVSNGLHAKTLQGKTVNVKQRPGLSWPVPDPR